MASLAQVHGACTPHAPVRASGTPTPGVDVQSCKSECNWLTGDKPLWGWHIRANKCRHGATRRFLVLHGAPQALGEDVIAGASAAIHADFDICVLQLFEIARAGKVAALIAVADFRRGLHLRAFVRDQTP